MLEKKNEKEFMKQIKKEALEESKDDIKAGMKEKIKTDYIAKMTTSKKDKLKKAFSMDAFGDIHGKLDRMTGVKSGSDKMEKMMGTKTVNNDKMEKMMGKVKMTDMGKVNKFDKFAQPSMNLKEKLERMTGKKKE